MIVQLSGRDCHGCRCWQCDGEHGILRLGRHLLFHDELLTCQLLQFQCQIDSEGMVLGVVDVHHKELLRRLLIDTGIWRHDVVKGTQTHHHFIGGMGKTACPKECGAQQDDDAPRMAKLLIKGMYC